MKQTGENLSSSKIWILAIRPKTLPASIGPVVMGTALALGDGVFRFGPAAAAFVAALLLQIGSNLANDVFDFIKGTDTRERTGPVRVTQAGLLSPRRVKSGMWVVFALAVLLGAYLVWVGGWPIIVIGILAIAAAIAYTGGPYPLGYHGLGEVLVFIFFGPVAVCGTYYVQALELTTVVWWASLPMGFLISALLVVNNIRDIETDKKTGKKTLAVRLGLFGAQMEYYILLAVSMAIPLVMYLCGLSSPWILISWLSLFLIPPLTRDIRLKKGAPLNVTLAGTARLGLVFSILFSIGYLLNKLLV
ncbi:MAG: 1,4-dihydroxy-2-naphthoate polyprenyltransferase [Peptococcaceae bacterium]|nr:1,4-dihydroxy-2-naphthoate polyprenyltransferase [Candidatus Syntrophopropionicum ammoniitolerans]